MSALALTYWFVVAFAAIFALSTGMGLAFGFPLREALAGAFWQTLIISIAGAVFYGAVEFGLYLMAVAS